ncbi:MAG TPA: glycosyltransferase [Candidatus Baltobacteraceae bacterium]|jgi:glycosyltransferase involved in cell wall biosynthesis
MVPLLKTEPRFSIIIPAHNEQDRIESTLEQYARAFADSEIIVALNGCTDGTLAAVERVEARTLNVRHVEIPETIGKGGAVRAGFMLARASVVGYVDADGATAAGEMRRLCESLETDDGVIASRWVPGAAIDRKQTLLRRAASRTFNLIVRVLFGLPYADTQCGAKVFSRSSLELAMRHVETSNLAFDVDLLFVMKALGLSVREEPTYWSDVEGSRLRLGQASRLMLAAVIRLRLRHSILRLLVPVYDRLFPTRPVRVKDRYNILVMNWRDPKHPQAGGAEKYLFEQAKRWLRRGHYVEWLSGGFAGGAARDSIDSIPIRRVGNAVTVYAAVPWTYVTEFRDRFDVILDAENGLPFFSPLYSLKPKLCIVHHVHLEVFRKHLPAWLAYPLMLCERTIVPLVYRNVPFVAVSEDTRAEMNAIGMSKRPVSIVYNGVDGDLVPGPKAPLPTILYLGRLMPYKRVDLLIDALAEVRESVPNASLVVAGDGPERPVLEKRAERLGLTSCVTFEGFVDERRKRELLQKAWVLVNPSEIEGWGVSVIEANACGTAAVAFDVPGLRESVRHNQTGLVVPKDAELAPSILSLLRDSALRERLERGAVAWARNFSWDRSADGMLKEMDKAVVGFDRSLVEAKR